MTRSIASKRHRLTGSTRNKHVRFDLDTRDDGNSLEKEPRKRMCDHASGRVLRHGSSPKAKPRVCLKKRSQTRSKPRKEKGFRTSARRKTSKHMRGRVVRVVPQRSKPRKGQRLRTSAQRKTMKIRRGRVIRLVRQPKGKGKRSGGCESRPAAISHYASTYEMLYMYEHQTASIFFSRQFCATSGFLLWMRPFSCRRYCVLALVFFSPISSVYAIYSSVHWILAIETATILKRWTHDDIILWTNEKFSRNDIFSSFLRKPIYPLAMNEWHAWKANRNLLEVTSPTTLRPPHKHFRSAGTEFCVYMLPIFFSSSTKQVHKIYGSRGLKFKNLYQKRSISKYWILL